MIDALARAAGATIECVPKIPSLAYRLVQVARGTLDIATASRDAHDWDIAAADLIVHEAGGRLTTRQGERPVFNRKSLIHRSLFAAPSKLHPALMAAARGA
jgi:myo-inositol-1(or 4)-monophosphatase